MVKRPVAAIAVGLALLFTWSACGDGGDDGAPSPEAAVEPPAAGREAQIRTVLADEYLDEAWYVRVQDIKARGSTARVTARLNEGRRGRGTAWEICGAVLRTPRVSRVIVLYSPTTRVVCR